jgi:hypothetical protein
MGLQKSKQIGPYACDLKSFKAKPIRHFFVKYIPASKLGFFICGDIWKPINYAYMLHTKSKYPTINYGTHYTRGQNSHGRGKYS